MQLLPILFCLYFLTSPIFGYAINHSTLEPRRFSVEAKAAREKIDEIVKDFRTVPLKSPPNSLTAINDIVPGNHYAAWSYSPTERNPHSFLLVVGKDPATRQTSYWAGAIPQKFLSTLLQNTAENRLEEVYDSALKWVLQGEGTRPDFAQEGFSEPFKDFIFDKRKWPQTMSTATILVLAPKQMHKELQKTVAYELRMKQTAEMAKDILQTRRQPVIMALPFNNPDGFKKGLFHLFFERRTDGSVVLWRGGRPIFHIPADGDIEYTEGNFVKGYEPTGPRKDSLIKDIEPPEGWPC